MRIRVDRDRAVADFIRLARVAGIHALGLFVGQGIAGQEAEEKEGKEGSKERGRE